MEKSEISVLDSSVWVALYLDTDSHHAKAVVLVESLRGLVHVPYLVVAEVATVLTRKGSKEHAYQFLEYITTNSDFVTMHGDMIEEIREFVNVKKRLSFTDIAVVHYARKRGMTLLTFDKEMLRWFEKSMGAQQTS